MGSLKWTATIRVIAAAYIIYLAISIIMEIQKGAVTGGMLALGIIGVVVFFAFSVWCFYSVYKMVTSAPKQKGDDGTAVDEEEARRIAEEEEKARIIAAAEGTDRSNSLFAKMERMSANSEEDQEDQEEE